jgi:hypothetical protein
MASIPKKVNPLFKLSRKKLAYLKYNRNPKLIDMAIASHNFRFRPWDLWIILARKKSSRMLKKIINKYLVPPHE